MEEGKQKAKMQTNPIMQQQQQTDRKGHGHSIAARQGEKKKCARKRRIWRQCGRRRGRNRFIDTETETHNGCLAGRLHAARLPLPGWRKMRDHQDHTHIPHTHNVKSNWRGKGKGVEGWKGVVGEKKVKDVHRLEMEIDHTLSTRCVIPVPVQSHHV